MINQGFSQEQTPGAIIYCDGRDSWGFMVGNFTINAGDDGIYTPTL